MSRVEANIVECECCLPTCMYLYCCAVQRVICTCRTWRKMTVNMKFQLQALTVTVATCVHLRVQLSFQAAMIMYQLIAVDISLLALTTNSYLELQNAIFVSRTYRKWTLKTQFRQQTQTVSATRVHHTVHLSLQVATIVYPLATPTVGLPA